MRAAAVVFGALAVAGCDARSEAPPLDHPVRLEVSGKPVAPVSARVGALTFAGGIELSARGSSLFGGLSGLDVDDEGGFLMVTDEGDLVQGRIVLDVAGRLTGLSDVTIRRLLSDEHGAVSGKDDGDAEDVTVLPDGGFAVSFERRHRVLAYAGPAGPVRRVLDPDGRRFVTAFEGGARLQSNRGLEGLTWADGLVVGTEDGRVFSCPDSRRCRSRAYGRPGGGWSLTGLASLDGDRLISVWRGNPLFGWKGAIVGPDGRELARLDGPIGANYEGIAAVRRGDGWRIYVVADDGFGESGRNLMLAFDWTP